MDKYLETMTSMKPFARYQRGPGGEHQKKAHHLCWLINQSDPDDMEKRTALIKDLVGTYPREKRRGFHPERL